MTLHTLKQYLLTNTTLANIRITKSNRYGHTLWGYKYPPKIIGKYWSLNQQKLKDKYEQQTAHIIVNEREIDMESIKRDIEMNNLTKVIHISDPMQNT